MAATKRQWIVRGILTVIAIAVIGYLYVKYRVAPELELQQLQLVSLQGEPISPSSFIGKNILLTAFATWCGPCHAEIAHMEAIRPQLEAADFVLIHISDETAGKINGFIASNPSGITYYRSTTPLKKAGLHTYPTHFVFDKQGKLRFKRTNPLDWQKPETVQELIKATQ